MKNLRPIHYRIFPKSPEAHLFEVTCTVDDPDPDGQRFALPAWIPGSYMIREFARHVVTITAKAGRRPLAVAKLDKHTWMAAPSAGPITVTMVVYAWDLSVRGAHLDTGHGFFNGPCVFLRVLAENTSLARWISSGPPAHDTANGNSPQECGVIRHHHMDSGPTRPATTMNSSIIRSRWALSPWQHSRLPVYLTKSRSQGGIMPMSIDYAGI